MTLRASIDIGSNSILMLIAEMRDDGVLHPVEDMARITGLGLGLDGTGDFIDKSMNDSIVVLAEYFNIIQKYMIPAKDVIVTATEASRVARNAKKFFSIIREKFGFITKIISSEGEAYYTAKGVLSGKYMDRSFVIMDIGGASTELVEISKEDSSVQCQISLPVGAVRGTEWIDAEIFEDKMKEVFHYGLDQFQTESMICVAGTMTSLAAMMKGLSIYNQNIVDGSEISFRQLVGFYQKIDGLTEDEILDCYPVIGKRVKTIKAGLRVAIMICRQLQVNNIVISTRGLRYGVLLEDGVADRLLF